MKTVIFQISFLKSFMLKSHARIDSNFDTFEICTKRCCLEAMSEHHLGYLVCPVHTILIYTALHLTQGGERAVLCSLAPFVFILSPIINRCIVLNVKLKKKLAHSPSPICSALNAYFLPMMLIMRLCFLFKVQF